MEQEFALQRLHDRAPLEPIVGSWPTAVDELLDRAHWIGATVHGGRLTAGYWIDIAPLPVRGREEAAGATLEQAARTLIDLALDIHPKVAAHA